MSHQAHNLISGFETGARVLAAGVAADVQRKRAIFAQQDESNRRLGNVAQIARAMAADRQEIARLQAELAAMRTRALRAEGRLIQIEKTSRRA